MKKITRCIFNTSFDKNRRSHNHSRTGSQWSLILLLVLGLLQFNLGNAQGYSGEECLDPLAKTLGYNAFVKYTTIVVYGDTEGPVATGGNFKIKGNMTLAAHTAGDNFYGDDEQAASLVVGGKMVYSYGYAAKLNNGFVKIGNDYGTNAYDKDYNGADVNLRLTGGSYWSKPRLQVQRKQDASDVVANDVIDFHGAFEHLGKVSGKLASLKSNVAFENGYELNLQPGQLNVLNISGRELCDIRNLTLKNKPSADTPLIINVDANYNLYWYVQNMAGVGGEEGKYIIWNFFNADNLILKGGGSLTGSVLAPKTTVYKKSSGNIDGQVIAKNYVHYCGELHYKPFETSCTPGGPGEPEECPYDVAVQEEITIVNGEEATLSVDVTDNSTSTAYNLIDTEYCKDDKVVDGYVLWLRSRLENRYFRNIDLIWTVNDNGTASLKGTVLDYQFTNEVFKVDVKYSGFEQGPSTNLKGHDCHSYDPTDWVFYRDIEGTVSSMDGSEKWELSSRGPGLQVGNDANNTEKQEGIFNASGWFQTDAGDEDDDYVIGDFNFNIGEKAPCEPVYKWSTEETTSTIQVSPTETTIYTVTVSSNGCNNCVIEKQIKVNVEPNCTYEVALEEEVTITQGQETTLTASVTDTKTSKSYNLIDTEYCKDDKVVDGYVLWLRSRLENRYFRNVDLIWTVNDDGTASLKGTVLDYQFTNEIFKVNVEYSGFEQGPSTNIKGHDCHSYDPTDWVFYRDIVGTVSSLDGSEVWELSSRGPGLQVGNDANNTEKQQGVYNASGWFETDAGDEDDDYVIGDFNFNIGEEIKCEPVYKWSTGETTSSITVSPHETKTYTVKVSSDGCNDCEIIKKITVKVEPKACEEYVKPRNTVIYNNGRIYMDVKSCTRQCFYVKIYDCYGNPKTQQLYTYVNCGNNTIELDFGRLVPHNRDGVYYIVTYLSGQKYVDRIVIK